jgi:hypothetical protein
MKAFRFISSVLRKVLLLAVSAAVGLGATFSFPASVALAAPEDPQNYVNTKSLDHLQRSLIKQQANVEKAYALVPEYENLFMEAGWYGIDTTSIAAALTTYQSQLDAAVPFITSAADILSAHEGYDDSGKVIDLAAATLTIKNARAALLDARVLLVKAGRDFTTALKAWKRTQPQIMQIERLQAALVNYQTWLSRQQTDLGSAAALVADFENLISVAKTNGFNAQDLVQMLKIYNKKIVLAQTANTAAANTLSTHSGYDASGNVTNIHDATLTTDAASAALLIGSNELGRSTGRIMRNVVTWKVGRGITSKSTTYAAYITAYNNSVKLYNAVHEENGDRISNLDARLNELITAISKIP